MEIMFIIIIFVSGLVLGAIFVATLAISDSPLVTAIQYTHANENM